MILNTPLNYYTGQHLYTFHDNIYPTIYINRYSVCVKFALMY